MVMFCEPWLGLLEGQSEITPVPTTDIEVALTAMIQKYSWGYLLGIYIFLWLYSFYSGFSVS
jgi:hypothetical protein